ncbi:AbrB/MazE/SpoVT family DNA-binding domain-containing protein [Microvirga sp. VF16]|uniref:AbrB/MazE/SpoVT family DNA-binding domain-containing protein n=1 Tax=Microvirga sp. VF16 TaxID=2807101 RepID=UPI00193D6196|nr:AbrB/MazE/SpoVT family DNA-binding domain-containing protein [Microvirga sp. VF16]QRM32341.1 AbrB/MazE/SpoVT family DNA-binding domain-containing protein [Microvirga sp. VF16]
MRVQFAQWGNSLALRIPQAFAREISARPGRQAELTVQGGTLVIEPIDEAPVYTLEELLEGITPENLHGETSMGRAVGNEFA